MSSQETSAQAPCSGFTNFQKLNFNIKSTLDSVKVDSLVLGICVRIDSGTVVTFYLDSANRQMALFNSKTNDDSPDVKLSCLSISNPQYSPMCGSPSCSEDTGTAFLNNLCTTCDIKACGIKYTCPKTDLYFLYISDRNNNPVGGWLKFVAEPKPNDTLIIGDSIQASACPHADTINITGYFRKLVRPSRYVSYDSVLSERSHGRFCEAKKRRRAAAAGHHAHRGRLGQQLHAAFPERRPAPACLSPQPYHQLRFRPAQRQRKHEVQLLPRRVE